MPVLEVRRHSMRPKPGVHLSQEGVTLARRVGEGIGPFDRVLTSTLPRAFETAIALGFAVTDEVEWLLSAGQAVERELPWPQSFAAYAAAFGDGWAVAAFAQEQAEHWREVVRELPEDGAALLVSHGGVMEMGAVGCLLADNMTVDFVQWGGPIDYCEGVRLRFAGERCTGGEVLRISTGSGGAAEKR
jgi:broad specificity phosphatase PhoE